MHIFKPVRYINTCICNFDISWMKHNIKYLLVNCLPLSPKTHSFSLNTSTERSLTLTLSSSHPLLLPELHRGSEDLMLRLREEGTGRFANPTTLDFLKKPSQRAATHAQSRCSRRLFCSRLSLSPTFLPEWIKRQAEGLRYRNQSRFAHYEPLFKIWITLSR